MRGSGGRRILAAAILAALTSSSFAGWALAFHRTEPDHHGGQGQDHDGAAALELVLHGHAHEQGAPAHGHPLLNSSPARTPGRQTLVIPAALVHAAEPAAAPCRIRPFLAGGPTHDPPPRPVSRPVLRI